MKLTRLWNGVAAHLWLACGTAYVGYMLFTRGPSLIAMVGLYMFGVAAGMRIAQALLRGPTVPAA